MAEVLTGSNSYVTEDEASDYFEDRLHADAWTSANADNQAKALVTAAVLLDRHIVWQGAKASPDQGMEWPRLCIPGITFTTVPKAVKVAQMELALVLLAKDTTALPDTAGMKSIQADTIKIEVDPDDRVKVIPDQVFALVASYGFRSGGLRSISLRRV
jgi:hypothetical protein